MNQALTHSPGEKFQYNESVIFDQSKSASVLEFRVFDKASFLIKTVACIIDQGIIFVPALIISSLFATSFMLLSSKSNIDIYFLRSVGFGIFMSSLIMVHWLYFTILESTSKKATLGMSIMGIKVQKKHGVGLTFFDANNRYWTWIFSSLFFGINLLGLAGHNRNLFHDQICNTFVVEDS